MSDGSTIIDTPEAMEHYRMLQVIGALHIETVTGMRHSRGSVMNLAHQRYGIDKRTKVGVLADLRALYAQTYGHECSIGKGR